MAIMDLLVFYIKKNKETMLVDLFIMSCRIMGRYLENWILNEIKKIAINNKKKIFYLNLYQQKRTKN